MTVYDFIAQYALVVLGVLAVAHRDCWKLATDNGVEKAIRQQERDDAAFEAKLWLAKIACQSVGSA